ncbi:MAG: hypothetical protein A3E78_15165 [Alphaproteobacteria bacterium RIFCSPHIGHO2_12_FULL_63_12]|nr:MAG: hypothetical protein A3E78_15165 [Alphaproteobacteria bacterium RIFCSPHIGHO2_12_FULL_63_12]
MEGFLTSFGTSPWGPMALAFLFGIAFGWVVWGAKPDRRETGEDAGAPIGDPKEIVVIKAEIEAARTLLGQNDEPGDELSEQLATLDETVKRANGRLKMILAAIRRAAKS